MFEISDTVSVFTTNPDSVRYQVTSGSYYAVICCLCSMSSDLDTHGAIMSIVSEDGHTEDITITSGMSYTELLGIEPEGPIYAIDDF